MVKNPFHIDPSHTAAFARLMKRADKDVLRDCSDFTNDDFTAVVIGGGTGSPVSIRTLLSLGVSTSAVVAMADDGGSTGRLRETADVTPPGDIRKCIAAFADDPYDPLVKAFKYRFAIADDHALGNLMLAALEDACGSFVDAIEICERLVNAQGHVYPSTLNHITLSGRTRDGRTLDGQAVACHSKTALESIALEAQVEGERISAYAGAVRAIEQADLIVLGPGSLFTSILAALQVPGIIDAIAASRGAVVFVCSLADVQGETWGLTALEHVRALIDAGLEGLIDYVLVHAPYDLRLDSTGTGSFNALIGGEGEYSSRASMDDVQLANSVKPVSVNYQDVQAIQALGPVVIARNLADAENPTWHSPQALREAFLQVMKLIESRKS